MQIAGFLKTSLVEWPGKISSVIFTLGCNFRCPFCHNADLVDPRKFSKNLLIKREQVLEDLEKRKNWIDAVVISGGEPTLQEDLLDFLKEIKKMNLLAMVETNGTNPLVIATLLEKKLVNFFSMDLKGDLGNYGKFTNTNCNITNIKKSIEEIIKSGVEYEFRTTVVPGLHDSDNLSRLAGEIDEIFAGYKLQIKGCHWYLQKFRAMNTLDSSYLNLKSFSEEEMKKMQKQLQKIIPQTFLRGV